MAREEIHVGDVGTVFTVTVRDGGTAVDVSTASTRKIKIVKPDGSLLEKTAALVTDGTNGKIKYTTIAGDLDQAGQYRLQVHLVIGSGSWHSDVGSFTVHENLS